MFYLYDDRHKQREKGAIFMRFVYKYYAVVGSKLKVSHGPQHVFIKPL